MSLHNVYKPLGWTPLDVIDALRAAAAYLRDVPMTYVGRLDPMAEGVLLILSGEDRFRREEFLGLSKTYAATFVFGYRTDTHDALGLPEKGNGIAAPEVEAALWKLPGEHLLPFPAYSSYRIKGKPLHWWVQHGRLHEIQRPMKVMQVNDVRSVKVQVRSVEELCREIVAGIAQVHGDFRQDLIAQQWRSTLLNNGELVVASCTLDVTSGTYIRALAHELGARLGCGAFLLRLTRTSVGGYTWENAERIEGERQENRIFSRGN